MLNHPVIAGILGGVASSLLFLAAASGTALAVPLMIFSPLPLMLVGLGWAGRANLFTLAAFMAVIALLAHPLLAVMAAMIVAAPSLASAYFHSLSRPAEEIGGPQGEIAWFPIKITFTRGLFVFCIGFVAAGLMAGFSASEFEQLISAGLKELFSDLAASPNGASISQERLDELTKALVRWLPVSMSATWVCILAGNFVFADSITRNSARSARPSSHFAANISLQPIAATIFVASCFIFATQTNNASLVAIAGSVAGAFGAGFMLIGLGVLHHVTKGMFGRTFVLTCAYFILIIFGFPALIFALLGFAEIFIGLRRKGEPNL